MYSLILSLKYKMAALQFILTYKTAQVFQTGLSLRTRGLGFPPATDPQLL